MQKKATFFKIFLYTLIFECDTLIFLRKNKLLLIKKNNDWALKMSSFELIFDWGKNEMKKYLLILKEKVFNKNVK